MFFKNSLFLIFFLIISCQPIEVVSPVDIDNSNLDRISINAKELLISNRYNSIFSSENIEDQIKKPPLKLIESWIKENITYFGNENKLIINIFDASILKKEIVNVDAKKYEEKEIYQYVVSFLVEYELYNDSNFLLANTTVETSRSTTSKKYISLNETDLIINDLLNKSLKEFIIESKSMTKLYMAEYIQ